MLEVPSSELAGIFLVLFLSPRRRRLGLAAFGSSVSWLVGSVRWAVNRMTTHCATYQELCGEGGVPLDRSERERRREYHVLSW